jgi:predicted homoserine dehydrogenase-like protein
VVFEGETSTSAEYGVKTDPSGRYACMYKRWHMIGLEVGISVASVGLRGEPTGCATGWRADAVATAKKDLKAGEVLDCEGGYTVVGRLMPAAASLKEGCLPLGLAHGWKMLKPVKAGQALRWSDVALTRAAAVKLRLSWSFCFPGSENLGMVGPCRPLYAGAPKPQGSQIGA